jgi:hypothetical protein
MSRRGLCGAFPDAPVQGRQQTGKTHDLRDRIAAKFNVHLDERSVGKLLKKLNFSSMSVRPVHPQSDLETQEALKKTSLSWRAPQSRRSLRAGRSKSGLRCYEGGQLAL